MMRWIIGSWLRFRLLVVGIAAGVMVVGITQLRNAPVDVLPEFTPPYVEVQTEALGLSAEEVEQLVTVPLEADLLNGTEGRHGAALRVRPRAVVDHAALRARDRPHATRASSCRSSSRRRTRTRTSRQPPQMLQPLSSESRVMIIGLSPNKLSPIQPSVLARWTIRPRLLGVDGVANVSIFGLRDRQLQVLVDPSGCATSTSR